MERRGFFGRLGAGIATAMTGLSSGKAATVETEYDDTFAKIALAELKMAWGEARRYAGLADDAEAKLAHAERCVEACRIMAEYGIFPVRYLGETWQVKGWHGHRNGGFFSARVRSPDPITALIEAEPLYLRWRNMNSGERCDYLREQFYLDG